VEWVTVLTGSRGLWGQALRDEMENYNHQVGLKMVGEMLPDERNRVSLADETDQYGLRVARVTYRWGDNDKALSGMHWIRCRSASRLSARGTFSVKRTTRIISPERPVWAMILARVW
jgi:hypothetical protein